MRDGLLKIGPSLLARILPGEGTCLLSVIASGILIKDKGLGSLYGAHFRFARGDSRANAAIK